MSVKLKSGQEIRLKTIHFSDKPDEVNIYRLVPLVGGNVYLKLELKDNRFQILEQSLEIDEDGELLQEKLDELLLLINPMEASIGTEDNEIDDLDTNPYDPEKIRVDTKPFSLRQIYDMIEMGDIDLSPDFQRNLVWDNLRKSRLIESILLRIPLPMFYFAQDEDGKISVVDGLQRLSTIREFMDNNFSLNNLEYLQDKCGGKYYNHSEKNKSIDPKYFRWFNMTQITVNVIDPSSPFKLKYDIFRRINTGGQPLNAQEIRNCLASGSLRSALREMARLDSFYSATGWSVKDVRMEAQELALRFIVFYTKHNEDPSLNNYSGNIDYELNTYTELLSKNKSFNYQYYISLFDNAMKNAWHLFGDYSFRKCLIDHLKPGARRQLINKALFVSWSVLLAQFDNDTIVTKNKKDALVYPLAERITNDNELLMYLTYGTNSKANIQSAFKAANDLISANLNY
ncbi:uncharacterized protein DUF262 [Chitinophaga japonensis]|uniref:Uncharacterized protein DUF262 n=2 Tax=Chitinophaga japonensis TaxID=104662 RepID=A0A562T6U4_CHIJA|nr:uncharacterized protein DUF262 [Chitinophaga japonensis]